MEKRILMQSIIDCYNLQDRIGLDAILRLYHKEVAKSYGIDPYDYKRFMKLAKQANQVELQRSAVDILKGYQLINKEAKLPKFLDEELKLFVKKLQDYINK